jgi:hypothetical protein
MGPEWKSQRHLHAHFGLHGRRLRLRTESAYDESARNTIEVGTRFNYRDPESREWRIGFYDRVTGRLTVLSDDETEIVTHYRCPERYVENLLSSDYT